MTTTITDEDYPVRFDPPVITRGADWMGFSFQHLEDDNVTPIDITGYTAEMVIKDSWEGVTYRTLINGSGITMTASTGIFSVSLAEADVAALEFKSAVYKLIVTDASGNVTPYFTGKLEVIG